MGLERRHGKSGKRNDNKRGGEEEEDERRPQVKRRESSHLLSSGPQLVQISGEPMVSSCVSVFHISASLSSLLIYSYLIRII